MLILYLCLPIRLLGIFLFVILLLVFVPLEIMYGESFVLLFSLIGLKEKTRQTKALLFILKPLVKPIHFTYWLEGFEDSR